MRPNYSYKDHKMKAISKLTVVLLFLIIVGASIFFIRSTIKEPTAEVVSIDLKGLETLNIVTASIPTLFLYSSIGCSVPDM